MPFFVPLVTGFLTGLGGIAAGAVGLTVGAAAALAIGSSIIAVGIYSYRRYADLMDVSAVSGARPRSQTREYVARSTESPRTIAYGEVTVGGVMTWWNTAGTENRDMYIEIVLTGHEIDSFIGFYIGDRYVPVADVAMIGVLDLTSSVYRWTASGSGTNEYYLELAGGGDSGISEPTDFIEDGAYRGTATAGSLTAGTWDWADNDSLGFSTIYVRLTDGADPDSKADGFLHAEYGDGEVTADTEDHQYDPPADTGVTILWLRAHHGISAQAVDQQLNAAFTEITTTHRHRGQARLNVKMHLLDGFENVWDGGVLPETIRTVIRGARVYDPRLDSTFTGAEYGSGSGAHRLNDPSTWEWSNNPSLIYADYRTNVLGPEWSTSRVNYDLVAVGADVCDELVDVPTASTEKRFTCDMAASTADNPGDVIEKILGSMYGEERDFNGQWHVYPGVFEAPSMTLTAHDFIGRTPYRKEPQFSDRYNLVRGGYYDPDRDYKFSPFLEVSDNELLVNRDENIDLPKELRLEATNSEYMAQRIAFRHLNQAALTGIMVVTVGYKASNLRIGSRVTVDHETLGFDGKIFRVTKIEFVPLVGYRLTLKEDAEAAYDDPDEGDYGQRTAAGAITFPRPIRARVPSGLVRDPSFADDYGVSWFTRGGFNGTIVAGETGNALRLGTSSNTTGKWYVGNRAQFEASNREWFTIQTRIMRGGDFSGSAVAQIGVTVLDADGSEVAEAEVVIDAANYATLMPSASTWYDLILTAQVVQTFTTSRQFGIVTVSKSNGGTAFGSPQLDFDFIQVIRGQAA